MNGEGVRLKVLGSDEVVVQSVLAQLEKVTLPPQVEVSAASLFDKSACSAEMALAIFGAGDSFDRYNQQIDTLKSGGVPVVLSLIDNSGDLVDLEHLQQISADEIIVLPVTPDDLVARIRTRIAALRIGREKKRSRQDVMRNQRFLGEILVEHRVIGNEQLQKALDYKATTDLRLGDVLVLLGYITDAQKNEFLASQLGVRCATARQYASADLTTIGLIPEQVAKEYTCIALERNETTLTVAMTDVLNLRLLDTLRDLTDLTIVPILGTGDDIKTAIERYYRDLSSQRDASTLVADLDENLEYVKHEVEEVNVDEAAAAGAELGIIKLVNMLIGNAVRDRASDIHIEPLESSLVVRYRVDGELRQVMMPPKRSHAAIITRIKILSNLDIAERRLPQDGRMVVKLGSREVDIRVSILPTVFGEKGVLRILDRDSFEKSVSNLGMVAEDLSVFKRNITRPYGMIIVTGPTGSGKSTTLYSAIQTVKSVTKNIVTVEDPVEFHMAGINQVNVNSKIGLSFSSALRSILRQDPDVVLIGEIRDFETADIAIKMALTGHLVFSTLHTNDAASTIARLVDIGIPPLLLGSSLNLVIAQRLVRLICPKCREEYSPPDEMVEQLNLREQTNAKFYRGAGCVNCNGTGYSGRTGLYEMMEVSRDIRTLILRNAGTLEIEEQAIKDNMKTLRQAGINLALRGLTTIEQVIAVTSDRL